MGKSNEGMDFDQMAREAGAAQLLSTIADAIATIPILVKVNKAYYDGCIAEGFTPEQSLELTKEHGYSLRASGSEK